jgi:hypothetical protein
MSATPLPSTPIPLVTAIRGITLLPPPPIPLVTYIRDPTFPPPVPLVISIKGGSDGAAV